MLMVTYRKKKQFETYYWHINILLSIFVKQNFKEKSKIQTNLTQGHDREN